MPVGYSDFDLLVVPNETQYSARVISSPAGQASASFAFPFNEDEIQQFYRCFDRTSRHLKFVTSANTVAKPFDVKAFGIRLFNAVFAEEIGKVFLRNLDEAERNGRGLRIRLRLSDAPELTDLPWEYLYVANSDRFPALSDKTPVVRYIELPQRERTLIVSPPLRILVIMSSPRDVQKLEVEQEWTRLNEALGELQEQGLLILERLEQPTLSVLLQRLRRDEVHILHFIGHGYFDSNRDVGGLVFEDRVGQSQEVTAEQLGVVFQDHGALRLVFLNACEGARGGRFTRFAGVAQKLVQQGVPAVLAMQFEVSDTAAIALAYEFYRALADGVAVDTATSEARKAIYVAGDEFEWGTPVLFSRSIDGVILDRGKGKDKEHMVQEGQQAWWNSVPTASQVQGDHIAITIGDNAKNIAAGKNITQTVYEALGEANPQDSQIIEQKLAAFATELKAKESALDEVKKQIAEFQMGLLKSELSKPEDETPSASTIIQVGDWLLDNIPDILEALTSLFATPAVGRVVGRAGERAVVWLKQRLSSYTATGA